MPCCGEDLLERRPEAERAVASGQLGGDRQATSLEVDQQLPPALGALPQADLKANQLLLALRRRADQHHDAPALGLTPPWQVNAVGREVEVVPPGRVAALPACVVPPPS